MLTGHYFHHPGNTVTDAEAISDYFLPERVLSAYLLGTLGLDALCSLQKRLVYDIGGDRNKAAVLLCDHPSCITIGREGSRAHIRTNFDRLCDRFHFQKHKHSSHSQSPVHWMSRGGGVMLHLPGQVACYPILPLELLGLTASRYVDELQNCALELLKALNLSGTIDPVQPGIRVNGRRVVHIGVAIRENITCYGLVVNVNPNLDLFHEVHCDGDPTPMTSLQRESSTCVRHSGIRQRLLELIADRFGFNRLSIFHNYPNATPRSKHYAAARRS
jgi:lipoyl(octanoyl) transferase